MRDELVAAQAATLDYAHLPDGPADVPSMRTIYWEQRRPERCHYRYGDKQRYFAVETGRALRRARCGQWPFARLPEAWPLDRFLPTP